MITSNSVTKFIQFSDSKTANYDKVVVRQKYFNMSGLFGKMYLFIFYLKSALKTLPMFW